MTAPEQLIIDTPEQIALEYPLASAGSRFLALGLDTLLQLAGFALLGLIAMLVAAADAGTGRPFGPWALAVLLLAAFALYYGYFAVFEALWAGQTPGKRVVGIRVIGVSGRPLSPFEAILRSLVRIVDQMPGFYAVGVLSIFFTSRNQRLGDLAAGTVVVHETLVERPHVPQPAEARTRHAAARLTPAELALVERFLQRRQGLDSLVRLATARQILARFRDRLELPADRPVDEERILEDLVEQQHWF